MVLLAHATATAANAATDAANVAKEAKFFVIKEAPPQEDKSVPPPSPQGQPMPDVGKCVPMKGKVVVGGM